jgi:hypothetical protein
VPGVPLNCAPVMTLVLSLVLDGSGIASRGEDEAYGQQAYYAKRLEGAPG